MAGKLLAIVETDFVKTFEIVIQLGAICAVVVLYFRKFFNINLIKRLIVAFIPTGIVGILLYPFIKGFLLGNSWITLNALFWGGIALIALEVLLKKLKIQNSKFETEGIKNITYKQAFLIGCFQCLSVIPGMSRAASTIIGGLAVKLDRSAATEFSFLLAVPTMVAASGYDLYKSRDIIAQGGTLTLILGTIFSFVFAMIAIKFLIGFVKKHDFKSFGIYRIVLSVLYYIFVK